ncbi:MAG: CaiB/BaiF CoA-transferase family protein [Pseudomonadota bacterium]
MTDTSMSPLAGIRVIDLTHAYAGPFATYHLALMGAEVIKVEAPGGDEFRHWREATFAQANAGKRSIVLDLKQPAGLEVLYRLIKDADVVTENLRPGAAAKLGIDWETLKALNPRLIFCSVSGYGQSGELRDRPAMEWSVQAMSGINSLYVDEDAPATTLGLSILDPFAGYMAFAGIMAALLQRQKTGIGQRIDIGMFDAAWVLGASSVTDVLTGQTPVSMVPRPNSARFMCRDRRLFISFIWPKWFVSLCDAFGAPELATDPRFATPAAMRLNGAMLITEVERHLAARDAADWAAELAQRGIPASPICSIGEAAAWPQVRARHLLETVQVDDGARSLEIVGSGIVFEHDGPRLRGPLPRLGEYTRAALQGAGYDAQQIEELLRAGAVACAES